MLMGTKAFPVLRTKRLMLRRVTDGDGTSILSYRREKGNFPHVQAAVLNSHQQVSEYIKKMNSGTDEGRWIFWGLCLREDEALIGTISLWNFNLQQRKAEVGFELFPSFRGWGYMEEALRLVLDYGFGVIGLNRIEGYTDVGNISSKALMERVGFNYVNEVEDGEGESVQIMDVYEICPSPVEIRKAVQADVPEISALIQSVLERVNARDYPPHVIEFMKVHYTSEKIEEYLKNKTVWVLCENTKGEKSEVALRGTISLYGDEIQALFVDWKSHGHGYGKRLMECAETYARMHGVKTLHLSASLSAKTFYERMGYQHIEFQDDENFGQSYLMEKNL